MSKNFQANLQDKRVFKTKSGISINYSFVSMYVTKLYKKYMELSAELTPELLKHNQKLQDKDFREEFLNNPEVKKEYDEKSGKLLLKAEQCNEIGFEIMKTIVDDNKQVFDYGENFEEFIEKKMDVENMNEFIRVANTVTDPRIKKK